MKIRTEVQHAPNEVTADLTFTRGLEKFASHTTKVTESSSKERINFSGSMNLFAPFRIYAIGFSVLKDIEKGTYQLKTDNRVSAAFSTSEYPNDIYEGLNGSVTFENAPTLDNLKGFFEFDAESSNPQRPEKGEIKNGVFSLSSDTSNSSQGKLSVKANINQTLSKSEPRQTVLFESTLIDMHDTIPDYFLEIVAFDEKNHAYIYVHIPKDKQNEKSLPIAADEGGQNAIVHFRMGPYFEKGIAGMIDFDFDRDKQTFTGNFSYTDKYSNTFEDGVIDVTGFSLK